MSSLEVSVATGRLAQISGQAVQLTIDAANLRYAAGSAASGGQDADLLCIDETFSIRRRAAGETPPDAADQTCCSAASTER